MWCALIRSSSSVQCVSRDAVRASRLEVVPVPYGGCPRLMPESVDGSSVQMSFVVIISVLGRMPLPLSGVPFLCSFLS